MTYDYKLVYRGTTVKQIEFQYFEMILLYAKPLQRLSSLQPHIYGILTLFDDTPTKEEQMKRRNFSIHSLQERIKILKDTYRNWNELLYKEASNIEEKKRSKSQ